MQRGKLRGYFKSPIVTWTEDGSEQIDLRHMLEAEGMTSGEAVLRWAEREEGAQRQEDGKIKNESHVEEINEWWSQFLRGRMISGQDEF